MKIHKVIFISILLFCMEARVSEVFEQDSKETLEELTQRAEIIVIAKVRLKDPGFVFKTVRFPKETHVSKSEESTYQEVAFHYEVKKFLKSKISRDKEIKVFSLPAYNEESIRASHETGMTESPIVQKYTAKFALGERKEQILFLNPHSEQNDIYVLLGTEGLGAESKIKKILE